MTSYILYLEGSRRFSHFNQFHWYRKSSDRFMVYEEQYNTHGILESQKIIFKTSDINEMKIWLDLNGFKLDRMRDGSEDIVRNLGTFRIYSLKR